MPLYNAKLKIHLAKYFGICTWWLMNYYIRPLNTEFVLNNVSSWTRNPLAAGLLTSHRWRPPLCSTHFHDQKELSVDIERKNPIGANLGSLFYTLLLNDVLLLLAVPWRKLKWP